MTCTRFTVFALVRASAPRLVHVQDAGQRRPIELGLDAALIHESDNFTSSHRRRSATRGSR
jgi:hypothetical protein